MKLFDVIVIIPPKVQKEDSAVEVIILLLIFSWSVGLIYLWVMKQDTEIAHAMVVLSFERGGSEESQDVHKTHVRPTIFPLVAPHLVEYQKYGRRQSGKQ